MALFYSGEDSSFYILDFIRSRRNVLKETILSIQTRFHNLLRDGFITGDRVSNKIKEDLLKLLELVKKETTVTAGDGNL